MKRISVVGEGETLYTWKDGYVVATEEVVEAARDAGRREGGAGMSAIDSLPDDLYEEAVNRGRREGIEQGRREERERMRKVVETKESRFDTAERDAWVLGYLKACDDILATLEEPKS